MRYGSRFGDRDERVGGRIDENACIAMDVFLDLRRAGGWIDGYRNGAGKQDTEVC
jgi:hypothetical protein